MYKIGIIDDNELYCLSLKHFLSREFEVKIFTKVSAFLQNPRSYDLVIVDYSIPAANYEKQIDGSELICLLKTTLPNPPLLILATGFLSRNELEIGREICPEADGFLAKDTGLEVILQQVKQLLATRQYQSTAVLP
jgi:DNA-binding NarL/FixJ family response regulator